VLESLTVSEALSLDADLLKPPFMVVSNCLNVIKEISSVSAKCMIIKEMLKKEEGFSMTTLSHQRCEQMERLSILNLIQ
jgi:hypothetical protein